MPLRGCEFRVLPPSARPASRMDNATSLAPKTPELPKPSLHPDPAPGRQGLARPGAALVSPHQAMPVLGMRRAPQGCKITRVSPDPSSREPSPLCPLLCASPHPHLLPARWEDTIYPCSVRGPGNARRQRLPGAALPSAGPGSRAAPRAPTVAATKLTGNFFPVQDNTCRQRDISPTQQCLRTVITRVHPTTHLGCRYLPGPQSPHRVQPSPAPDTAPSHRSWAMAVLTCPRATHSDRHAPAQPV